MSMKCFYIRLNGGLSGSIDLIFKMDGSFFVNQSNFSKCAANVYSNYNFHLLKIINIR